MVSIVEFDPEFHVNFIKKILAYLADINFCFSKIGIRQKNAVVLQWTELQKKW